MHKSHLPSLLLVLLATAAAIAGAVFLVASLPDHPWEGWALGKSGINQKYCELNDLGATIRQPANSWSNFVFFLFGGLVLRDVWLDRRAASGHPPFARFTAFGILLGLTFIGLCAGSFLFHASLTRIGQRWDMTFTYSLAAALLLGVLYRLGIPRLWRDSLQNRTLLLAAILTADVLFYTFKWSLKGHTVLGSMFLGVIVCALLLLVREKGRFSLRIALAAVSALVGAIVIMKLDVAKVGCDPDSYFQGHAVWHLLTGLSAYLTYQFLRRERVA